MFGEAVYLETLPDGFQDNLFKGSRRMPAELTGM
jgi:hypothetical protein